MEGPAAGRSGVPNARSLLRRGSQLGQAQQARDGDRGRQVSRRQRPAARHRQLASALGSGLGAVVRRSSTPWRTAPVWSISVVSSRSWASRSRAFSIACSSSGSCSVAYGGPAPPRSRSGPAPTSALCPWPPPAWLAAPPAWRPRSRPSPPPDVGSVAPLPADTVIYDGGGALMADIRPTRRPSDGQEDRVPGHITRRSSGTLGAVEVGTSGRWRGYDALRRAQIANKRGAVGADGGGLRSDGSDAVASSNPDAIGMPSEGAGR